MNVVNAAHVCPCGRGDGGKPMISTMMQERRLDDEGALMVAPEWREAVRALLKLPETWDGTRCLARDQT